MSWIFGLLACLLLTGLATPSLAQGTADYTLGTGDKLRITVFGEDDLSAEYEISATGMVSFPLIGQVGARGLTVSQLENAIEAKLREGYLKQPSVSVDVLNYRPFFIEGEVNEPGQYPYISGMTIREAVAIAGGYTYRAREETAILFRRSGEGRTEQKVPINTGVEPGDYIKIEERFF